LHHPDRAHERRGTFSTNKPHSVPIGQANPRKRQQRCKTQAQVSEFVREASNGEDSLVVTYKFSIDAFGDLPNVKTANFGTERGLNDWENVRHVFVIGRPHPDDFGVNRQARCLTGEIVPINKLVWQDKRVRIRGGTKRTIQVRRYSHPYLEMIRQSVADAGVIHAAGRGRGINRSEDNPVTVWLVGDAALDIPLDTLRTLDSPQEIMASADVILKNSVHAARAFPNLPSASAIRHRSARRKECERSIGTNYEALTDIPGVWIPFAYQLVGKGQKRAEGFFNTDLVPALERWLTERPGPVKNLALGKEEHY